MYDVMSWKRAVATSDEEWSPERHRTIEGAEAIAMAPALAAREPTSAYLFYDCQTDDVRLVLTVLGEAERFGAVCVQRLRGDRAWSSATAAPPGVLVPRRRGRRRSSSSSPTTWSTRPGSGPTSCAPTSSTARRRCRASGPAAARTSRSRSETLPVDSAGVIVPAGGGRSIFVLPWLGRTLIGTTDNDYEGSLDHVPPADDDVDYLLEAVNEFFGTSLGAGDLTGAYAGVRPLISTGDPKKSVDISRKAELYETSSGLVTITGGKLTTWRRMAKMAVDRIVEREGREAPCRTHEIPLGLPIEPAELPQPGGRGRRRSRATSRPATATPPSTCCGWSRSDPQLGERIVPELPDLVAEAAVRRAARAGAHGRRRAAAPHAPGPARRAPALCAPDAEGPRAVARAMGAELGWDEARVEAEVEAWRSVAAAEGLVPCARREPATVAGAPA